MAKTDEQEWTVTRLPRELADKLLILKVKTKVDVQDQVQMAVQFWLDCGNPASVNAEALRKIQQAIARHGTIDEAAASSETRTRKRTGTG